MLLSPQLRTKTRKSITYNFKHIQLKKLSTNKFQNLKITDPDKEISEFDSLSAPTSSEGNRKSCSLKQSSIFSSCASVSESVDLSDEEFKTDLLRKKAKKEQKKK